MGKVGLITIISIVINLFLTFWLVNQYLSDVYFQTYVNGTIGQYYPFIVLTFGVGGGSGLGYLFLKRKHGDNGLIGKIQKSKSFKPSGPLASTGSSSMTRASLPTGAPPAPVSKHTVYAVPSLPKSSSPSSSRSTSGTTWASAGTTRSSLESILSSKQDTTPRSSTSGTQVPQSEPPRPSSPAFPSVTEIQSPQPLRSIGESPTRQSPNWAGQQPSTSERRPESGPIFQKPGLDVGAKPDQSFTGFSSQPQAPQTSPVPSKWAPPDDKTGTNQWSEGGVKSIPPLPTKWTPPAGQINSQERPSPPPGFPRPGPGPGPVPGRGPVSAPPGAPRPFVVQGPGGPSRPIDQRPMGPPRPIAAPQQFRPDPNRPPPGMGAQPRPQNVPRPAAPLAGPMPQPWTPQSQTQEKKDYSSLGIGDSQHSVPTGTDASQAKQGSDQKNSPEGSGGGGEMDWDTALDTILKTLRKDRVGDTK
jgi:hypothetical protein